MLESNQKIPNEIPPLPDTGNTTAPTWRKRETFALIVLIAETVLLLLCWFIIYRVTINYIEVAIHRSRPGNHCEGILVAIAAIGIIAFSLIFAILGTIAATVATNTSKKFRIITAALPITSLLGAIAYFCWGYFY